MISLDTTNHCNARCIFCFNDWDSFAPCKMDAGTFENVLPILRLLSDDGQFLVSCWFEPTINRSFFDILKKIPPEYKERTYFTTNLACTLTDEQIECMCAASVRYINISLESYREEVYRKITNVKAGRFFENLGRVAEAAKRHGTKLRLISMMLRSNREEFVELVRRAHEEIGPAEHEIRTPFFYAGERENKSVIFDELLTRREIEETKREVEALGYTNLSWHTGTSKEDFLKYENVPGAYEDKKPGVTYWIRINADGSGRVGNPTEGTPFDLAHLPDPAGFVRKELAALEEQDAAAEEIPAEGLRIRHERCADPYSADVLNLYDGRFAELIGWETGALRKTKDGGERVAVLEREGRFTIVRMRPIARPDVAALLGDPQTAGAGFKALFDFGEDASLITDLREGAGSDPGFRLYSGYMTGRNVYLQTLLFGGEEKKRGLFRRR